MFRAAFSIDWDIGVGRREVFRDRDGNPLNPDHFMKIVKVNLFGTFNVASQSAAGMAAAEPLDDEAIHTLVYRLAVNVFRDRASANLIVVHHRKD